MILYGLIKLLLKLGDWAFQLLPNIPQPEMSWGWVDDFLNMFDVVFFLFPVYDLIPLILLIVLIGFVRIAIGILKFIFDAIPLY